MKKVILLTLISGLLIACQQGVVFSEFQSLPAQGWSADSVMVFSPNITDTMGDYQMQVTVRHTDRYPYQNLWLFVNVKKDSMVLRCDTIESFMANERGEWYGSGMKIYELPLLYLEHITLSEGEYEVTIQQGMREDILRGITDVGVSVLRIENKMGKNKLKKFAEMETFHNVFQCGARETLEGNSVVAMRGKWHEEYFGNDNPIVLELGCGRGEYTVGLAARYPDKNYIGIDIKGARMWAGAKQAELAGMKNVAFLRTNIEMLTHFFAPNEVAEIWITFP
ncbi:MAG: tRNA (guanosine(46)-N7)-methyltransferase TrmB, partial [Paludibacteraceae bacterium]|nr:tRNA (guanosine(46)-N7)-methyltransferase TrmB [Paludibacteraceae bacterium]